MPHKAYRVFLPSSLVGSLVHYSKASRPHYFSISKKLLKLELKGP
nr:MAG TPA: hypothetical protein [Caudoviricetes sp.]